MNTALVAATLTVALVGCATPTVMLQGPAQSGDKDTEYTVTETAEGFILAVAYARYQFIPESAALATACKQVLTATAYEVADKRRKKIEPVNEQRIRLSMGRNGFSGMTSCAASVPISWAR